MSKMRDTTNKLYAVSLILVMLAGVMPLVAQSAVVPPAGPLQVMDRTYTTPVGEVFGDPSTIFVRLVDPSKNTDPTKPDTVAGVTASRVGGTGSITFSLFETGESTGVFTGSFRAGTAASGTQQSATRSHAVFGNIYGEGFLTVVEDANISIRLAGGSPSTFVIWHKATSAAISSIPGAFDAPTSAGIISGYQSSIQIDITDADLARNGATTATGVLRAFSDSDPVGAFVTLVKLPSSPDTFRATVQFESVLDPSSPRIFARHGDRVRAIYEEKENSEGLPVTHELPKRPGGQVGFWLFKSTTSGVVLFSNPSYFGTGLDATSGNFGTRAVVQVFDPDRSFDSVAPDTLTATVASPRNAITSTLTEVGGLTGLFAADVPFRTAAHASCAPAATPPTDRLCVTHGDTITVTYNDPKGAAGFGLTVSSTAKFYLGEDGRAQVGPSATTKRLSGTVTPHSIQIFDKDANRNALARETVVATIKSSSDATGGIPVVLQEDADNSGVFVGSFVVTTGTPTATTLKVADRDLIVAEYQDALRADGTPGRIQSNVVTWRQLSDALVVLDSVEYARTKDATTGSPDYGQYVRVYVIDADQNDPFQVDEVPVTLVESVANARWPPSTLPAGTTQSVARETGPDTGIFTVNIPLGTGGVDAFGVPRFDPGLTTRNLQAEYLDASLSENGALRVVSSPVSKWYPGNDNTVLIRFETLDGASLNSISHAGSTDSNEGTTHDIQVRLSAYGVNTQSNSYSVVVDTRKCSGTNDKSISLTRTGSGTNFRWTRVITIGTVPSSTTLSTACASGANRVLINPPSTSTPERLHHQAFDTTSPAFRDTTYDVRILRPTPEKVQLTDSTGANLVNTAFGTSASSYAVLLGGDWNKNQKGRDVAILDIFQDPDNAPINTHSPPLSLFAVETGPDTGKFLASFQFKLGTPSGLLERNTFISGTPDDLGAVYAGTVDGRLCFNDNTSPGQGTVGQRDASENIYWVASGTCPVGTALQPGDIAFHDINAFVWASANRGDILQPGDNDLGLLVRAFPNAGGNITNLKTRTSGSPGPNIYMDVDGDGKISLGDIRISVPGFNDYTEVQRRSTSTNNPQQPDSDCGALVYPLAEPTQTSHTQCPFEIPLVPLSQASPTAALTRFSYLDINKDLKYDFHDAIYLDMNNNGVVDAGDFRYTRTLDPAGKFLPVLTPDPPFLAALQPALVSLRSPQVVSSVGGLYVYASTDATASTTTGFGLSVLARATIVDDPAAGYIFREAHTVPSGGREFTIRGDSMLETSPLVSLVVTERTATVQRGAGTSGPTPASVTTVSTLGVQDRNRDGVIDCLDVTVTLPCESVSGRVVSVTCAAVCSNVDLTYLALARNFGTRFTPSTASTADPFCEGLANTNPVNCNIYSVIVKDNKVIRFGAALPASTSVLIDYRQLRMPVKVQSVNTGETETLLFDFDATNKRYVGSIPVELTGTPGNGFVHVARGATPSDLLKFIYEDNAMADGKPGSSVLANFRSFIGQATWRLSERAVPTFYDSTFTTPLTGTALGPYVAVEVRDVDKDTTPEPDTFTISVRNGADPNDRIDVLMRETGNGAGVFRGVIPVNAGLSPLQQLDIAGSTGVILVSFQDDRDATGLPATIQTQINWKPSSDGSIKISDTAGVFTGSGPFVIRGTEGALYIQVVDADANTNIGVRESVQVTVTTPSDTVGESITLLETGFNTGVFESAGVRFETTLVPNNGKVYAQDLATSGEPIRVQYVDVRDAAGQTQRREPDATAVWDRTFDGVVSVTRSLLVGSTADTGNAGTITRMTIYVRDGDLNVNPNGVDEPVGVNDVVKVGFVGSTGALETPISMRLVETGANTGVFVAIIEMAGSNSAGTSVPSDSVGGVGVGSRETGTVRAAYTDARDSRGRANILFESLDVDWRQAGFGVVQLDATGYTAFDQEPKVTLVDRDLNTNPATVQTATVRVSSTSHPDGFDLTLTETGANTGEFTGEFGLTSGNTGGGKIRVGNTDTIRVRYADTAPVGDRIVTAGFSFADNLPPVTSITLSPAAPDGLRGYYRTDPLVTLSPNEQAKSIEVAVGLAGSPQPYTGPFNLAARFGQGEILLRYRSTDLFDNVEAFKNVTLKVDVAAPTQTVSGLQAAQAAGGKIRLSWTPAAVTTNPLDFFDYVVFRDAQMTVPLGNSTSPSFLDTTIADELNHTYRVAVRDIAGHVGPLSNPITAAADATLPVIGNATLTPIGFDLRAKPSGGIRVSVPVTDTHLSWVRASLVPPSGAAIDTKTLTAAAGSSTFTGNLSLANLTQPCACKVVISANDTAGNLATRELPYVITGPDTEAPQITAAGIPDDAKVIQGTPISITVTDNVAVAAVRYTLNGAAPVAVTVPAGSSTVTFNVPTASLALGAHVLVVNATDTARAVDGAAQPNGVEMSFAFELVKATVPPVQVDTKFLPTKVRVLANGSVRVTWEVPTSVAGLPLAGFQVWRASSPFVEVFNTTDNSTRTFLDTTTAKGGAYKYVTTFYLAGEAPASAINQVTGYPGSDDKLTGVGLTQQPSSGSALPSWLWIVIAALAVLVVGVLVAVVIAGRRKPGATTQQVVVEREPEPEAVDAEAEQAPVLESHRLKCPECQHRFEVSGTKPIVTHCPNCGRKGILR
jgi:hypothetical protein